MPYAQTSDLLSRLAPELIQSVADDNGDGAADDTILEAALDDASAEIDAVLGGRYAVPVAPIPDLLLRLAIDLAIYFLFIRRRSSVTAEHLARAREARSQLAALGAGELILEGVATRLARLESDSTAREQERLFDRQSLDSF